MCRRLLRICSPITTTTRGQNIIGNPQYASESGGDILPFVSYAVHGFVDGLKQQLVDIRNQQWDVTWRNFVHEHFRDKLSKVQKRRRDFLLELSGNRFVPIAKLIDSFPQLGRLNGNRTLRAIERDVDYLKQAGLVEKNSQGIRARKEIILAFLPLRKMPGESAKIKVQNGG